MHSFYGTNGDMSMSADSTCQGLQSPTLGVITMKFSKGKTSNNLYIYKSVQSSLNRIVILKVISHI